MRYSALSRLSSIGEHGFVELLGRLLGWQWRCSSLGWGDDASCLGGGFEGLLVKIDGGLVSSNTAPWMSLYDTGWLVAAGVFSDLAAKAGEPLAAVASVGVEPGWRSDMALALLRGVRDSCIAHGAWLAGGDTNGAVVGGSWVDVAAVALAPSRGPVARRPRRGDIVYTTVGRYGLQPVLFHAHQSVGRLPGWLAPAAVEASRPLARLGFRRLVEALPQGCVTGSVDVSDGLAFSLHLLSRAAGAPVVLESLPPMHPLAWRYAEQAGVDPLEAVLYGGQEYEVVFTARPGCGVAEAAESAGLQVARIGRVADAGGVGVYYCGVRLEARGWDNLRRSPP